MSVKVSVPIRKYLPDGWFNRREQEAFAKEEAEQIGCKPGSFEVEHEEDWDIDFSVWRVIPKEDICPGCFRVGCRRINEHLELFEGPRVKLRGIRKEEQ